MLEDAAHARAVESDILARNGHMCGAIYLAGYVVECRLKTLLNKMGKPFPKSGSAGHDLIGLWDAAGLPKARSTGFRSAFLEFWSTSMRYSSEVDSIHSAEDLFRGAKDLASFLSSRIVHVRGGSEKAIMTAPIEKESLRAALLNNLKRWGMKDAQVLIGAVGQGLPRVRIVHANLATWSPRERGDRLLAGIGIDRDLCELITPEEEEWYGVAFPENLTSLPIWTDVLSDEEPRGGHLLLPVIWTRT